MGKLCGALELLQSYGLQGFACVERPLPDQRVWPCDAEELVDGCVCEWLADLEIFLKARGATFGSCADIDRDDGHYVALNGREVLIMKRGEPDCARMAAIRSAQLVNSLLEQAGCEERGYLLYPGTNEGLILFFKPDCYARLIAHPNLDPIERPLDVSALA